MNFWVIVGYIGEEIVFLEGLVKLRKNRNIEGLVVLKLELVVNQLELVVNQVSPLATWGALAWVSTVCWCSKNRFLSSIPS